MKKFVWVFGLWLAMAQSLVAGPVGFGIRGGGVMASQTGLPSVPPYFTTDVVFGFSAGGFLEFGLNDFLSLQPEVDFVQKGYHGNINGVLVTGPTPSSGNTDGYFTDREDYLEIPLLVKVHKSLGPGFAGCLSVGPSLGILLGASESYSVTGFGSGSGPLTGLSNSDFGLMFGAGIELGQFLVDLRYDLGLSGTIPNYPYSPKNSVLSLQVGYRIL